MVMRGASFWDENEEFMITKKSSEITARFLVSFGVWNVIASMMEQHEFLKL